MLDVKRLNIGDVITKSCDPRYWTILKVKTTENKITYWCESHDKKYRTHISSGSIKTVNGSCIAAT